MIQFEYKKAYHNLGWLFYRNMYEDRLRPQHGRHRLDFSFLSASTEEDKARRKKELEERNGAAFQALCKEVTATVYPEPSYVLPKGQTLEMKTTYPGLLLGSGYAHETGVMGEFKLGFYFDSTSGLPLIPGSSVKGTLRSAFPQDGNDKIADKAAKAFGIWQALSRMEAAHFPARDWSAEYWSANPAPPEVQFIDALERAVFDGVDVAATAAKEGKETIYLSLYRRDIFHDAVIVSTANKQQHFLGMDFITPHLNRKHPELNAFTAPIPIQFLKLLPEVGLRFHFQVKDFVWGNLKLTAEQKVALFREILLRQGIGAKTNVGYGQFVREESNGSPNGGEGTPIQTGGPSSYDRRLSVGDPLEAQVVDPTKKVVRVVVKGKGYEVPLTGNCPHAADDLIRVKINQLDRTKTHIVQVGYLGQVK